MKSKTKTLTAIVLISTFISTRAQVIISQDFEGPLTGWVNQGVVTASQNGITPHQGGGMLALNSASTLTSPTFSLPSGAKNLTFWLNGYNPTPFTYTLSADLLQNSSSVLALGSWQSTLTAWTEIGINIPSGYSGNNYSFTYSVQTTDPTLKFYLDDISLSSGFVGLKDYNTINSDIKIINDVTNKTLKIYTNKNLENNNIQIMSIDGKVIFSKQSVDILKSSFTEINLPEVNEGLYILKLSNTNGALTKKLVF